MNYTNFEKGTIRRYKLKSTTTDKVLKYKIQFLNLLYGRFIIKEFNYQQNHKFRQLAYKRGTLACTKINGMKGVDEYDTFIIFDYEEIPGETRNNLSAQIRATADEQNKEPLLKNRIFTIGKDATLFWTSRYTPISDLDNLMINYIPPLVEIDERIDMMSDLIRQPKVITYENQDPNNKEEVNSFIDKFFRNHRFIALNSKIMRKIQVLDNKIDSGGLNDLITLRTALFDEALEAFGFSNLGRGEQSNKSHLLKDEIHVESSLTDANACLRFQQYEEFAKRVEDMTGKPLTPLMFINGSYVDPITNKKYYKIKGAGSSSEEGTPSLASVLLKDNASKSTIFGRASGTNYSSGGKYTVGNFQSGSETDKPNPPMINYTNMQQAIDFGKKYKEMKSLVDNSSINLNSHQIEDVVGNIFHPSAISGSNFQIDDNYLDAMQKGITRRYNFTIYSNNPNNFFGKKPVSDEHLNTLKRLKKQHMLTDEQKQLLAERGDYTTLDALIDEVFAPLPTGNYSIWDLYTYKNKMRMHEYLSLKLDKLYEEKLEEYKQSRKVSGRAPAFESADEDAWVQQFYDDFLSTKALIDKKMEMANELMNVTNTTNELMNVTNTTNPLMNNTVIKEIINATNISLADVVNDYKKLQNEISQMNLTDKLDIEYKKLENELMNISNVNDSYVVQSNISNATALNNTKVEEVEKISKSYYYSLIKARLQAGLSITMGTLLSLMIFARWYIVMLNTYGTGHNFISNDVNLNDVNNNINNYLTSVINGNDVRSFMSQPVQEQEGILRNLLKYIMPFIVKNVVYRITYKAYKYLIETYAPVFDKNHPIISHTIASFPAAFSVGAFGSTLDMNEMVAFAAQVAFSTELRNLINYVVTTFDPNDDYGFYTWTNKWWIKLPTDALTQYIAGRIVYNLNLCRGRRNTYESLGYRIINGGIVNTNDIDDSVGYDRALNTLLNVAKINQDIYGDEESQPLLDSNKQIIDTFLDKTFEKGRLTIPQDKIDKTIDTLVTVRDTSHYEDVGKIRKVFHRIQHQYEINHGEHYLGSSNQQDMESIQSVKDESDDVASKKTKKYERYQQVDRPVEYDPYGKKVIKLSKEHPALRAALTANIFHTITKKDLLNNVVRYLIVDDDNQDRKWVIFRDKQMETTIYGCSEIQDETFLRAMRENFDTIRKEYKTEKDSWFPSSSYLMYLEDLMIAMECAINDACKSI